MAKEALHLEDPEEELQEEDQLQECEEFHHQEQEDIKRMLEKVPCTCSVFITCFICFCFLDLSLQKQKRAVIKYKYCLQVKIQHLKEIIE